MTLSLEWCSTSFGFKRYSNLVECMFHETISQICLAHYIQDDDITDDHVTLSLWQVVTERWAFNICRMVVTTPGFKMKQPMSDVYILKIYPRNYKIILISCDIKNCSYLFNMMWFTNINIKNVSCWPLTCMWIDVEIILLCMSEQSHLCLTWYQALFIINK